MKKLLSKLLSVLMILTCISSNVSVLVYADNAKIEDNLSLVVHWPSAGMAASVSTGSEAGKFDSTKITVDTGDSNVSFEGAAFVDSDGNYITGKIYGGEEYTAYIWLKAADGYVFKYDSTFYTGNVEINGVNIGSMYKYVSSSIGSITATKQQYIQTGMPAENNAKYLRLMCDVSIISSDLLGYCGDTSVNNGKDVTWELSKSEGATDYDILTICGSGAMADYDDFLDQPWALHSSTIKKVVIDDDITNIGNYAFGRCTCLNDITIPNNVTSIGYKAFEQCTSLTDVTIPNSIISIDESAFANCTDLTSITIPNSITSMGAGAFEGCIGLTSVTIGSGITSIKKSTFEGCMSLSNITIPNNITCIGDNAFEGCTALTGISIPNSVTSIGDEAFYDCASLSSATIGNGVTSIGKEAFYECSLLSNLTIGNSVTSIGASAFHLCESLEYITIPGSVTSIGGGAFEDCTDLTRVEFKGTVGGNGTGISDDCDGDTVYTFLHVGYHYDDDEEEYVKNTEGVTLILPSSWKENLPNTYTGEWHGGYFKVSSSKMTPVASDFTYDSSNGVLTAVTGKNLGTVTTYYNVNDNWTTIKPTEANVYEVGVVTTGSDTYEAIGSENNPFADSSWTYTVIVKQSNNGSTSSRVVQSTLPVIQTPTSSGWQVGETRSITNAIVTKLSDHTCSFKDKTIHKSTISIPSTITVDGTKYTVVSLKRDCVHGHYVKKLIIPSTVTNFEYACFAGDKHLTNIKINSSKITVAKNLFRNVSMKQRKKIVVTVSKKMSKKNFNALRKALVKQGLKYSNIIYGNKVVSNKSNYGKG